MGSMAESTYRIEGTLRQLPLEEYMAGYFDPDRFFALCEHCPTYLTNWSCPPFTFDVREALGRYRYAHILVHRVTPDEQSCAGSYRPAPLSARAATYGESALYGWSLSALPATSLYTHCWRALPSSRPDAFVARVVGLRPEWHHRATSGYPDGVGRGGASATLPYDGLGTSLGRADP